MSQKLVELFYVLLTVLPGTTLGKWPTWCTITLYNTVIVTILLEISGIQDVRLKYKQNWINHLERMDNTRLPKHTLKYKPRGRRDRGRPRKRWQCVDAGTGQTTLSMEEDGNDDDDYNPLHDSNNSVLIIRRSNCINTASGIVFSVSGRPVCTPDGHL